VFRKFGQTKFPHAKCPSKCLSHFTQSRSHRIYWPRKLSGLIKIPPCEKILSIAAETLNVNLEIHRLSVGRLLKPILAMLPDAVCRLWLLQLPIVLPDQQQSYPSTDLCRMIANRIGHNIHGGRRSCNKAGIQCRPTCTCIFWHAYIRSSRPMYACMYMHAYIHIKHALYLSIYIALLTVWAFHKRSQPQQLTLCRSLHAETLQATASEGLAQGSYVATRARLETMTLRSKGIDSTNAPSRPTSIGLHIYIHNTCIGLDICIHNTCKHVCIHTHGRH